jgi:hypothetical protein
MSEEREVGWGKLVWSDQPTKEYLEMLPLAQVRKAIKVCPNCDRTVDYAWIGVLDEQGLQEVLDYLSEYLSRQDCADHHLPP